MKNESNEHQMPLTLRRSSARMQPTAQISTPVPYILAPNNSSGDLYHLRPEEILLQFLAYYSILKNKHFLLIKTILDLLWLPERGKMLPLWQMKPRSISLNF